MVQLVEEAATVGVEEFDGVPDEGGRVGAGEGDDGVGWAVFEDLCGDLGWEERVFEFEEGKFDDCCEGVVAGGFVGDADGAAEELGGEEFEGDVVLEAGSCEVGWGGFVVGPEDFGFREVDWVERILELAVEGCEAVVVVADCGDVVDDSDLGGVEALCGGCVVVFEGVAGDEGAPGAALDGAFALEAGGEGVVVGAPVDHDWGFAAVGEVDGAPGLLEGWVGVNVGEGEVSRGVLESGLVVGEESSAVGSEFDFNLDSVFGEF